jgi:CYTH domain-containing protein/CHAD domain-containing protein
MSYAFEPSEPLGEQCRLVLRERLMLAIAAVDVAEHGADDGSISTAVHDARKRCKEARALGRLIRPSIARRRADRFDRMVGRAAGELASLREAHALLATVDQLETFGGHELEASFTEEKRSRLVDVGRLTAEVHAPDGAMARARERLVGALESVDDLVEPVCGLSPKRQTVVLAKGIEASYATARRRHKKLTPAATDEQLHGWRTAVKRLWYHVRLLERCAPSVLSPLATELHDLGEALGDIHDLAMLVERVGDTSDAFGDATEVSAVIAAAREQQAELIDRALRLGSSMLVERSETFAARIGSYWKLARKAGPERPTGGIAALIDEERSGMEVGLGQRPDALVERERKFLVERLSDVPELRADTLELRQGYLAIDGPTSVRIRDDGRGSFTMTVKLGRGAVRTELEWWITAEQFAATWPHTDGRRVHKTRSTVPIEGATVDVDAFHGALDGLVMAEVEFDDDETMVGFDPPSWFGPELTDDPAYTNASLALAELSDDTVQEDSWRPPTGPRRDVGE